MDPVKTENEEYGIEGLTEEILEEDYNMAGLKRNEQLRLHPAIDEHRKEDHGSQALGENQDANFMDEKQKNEAREKIITELHRDVEMVKFQLEVEMVFELTGVKSIPSDDEIFALLEAHLKEEKRIKIVTDELLLHLLPARDEHMDEDHGNQVLDEKQDDNFILKVEEKQNDEAREKVITELHRDVEMVKLQLTDVKSIPSDDEIFAYLEAHLKEEKRIQIIADELRGTNTTESQPKNPFLNSVEANEPTGSSALKRKLSSSSDETTKQPVPEGRPYSLYSLQPTQSKTVSHGNEGSDSCPTLDIVEQMIQSVQEEDINTQSNQERMVLLKRPEAQVEIAEDGCKRLEVLVNTVLENTVLEIVPNIDQEYLRVRARDLVGHDAATERFILEILNDPTPPANWRHMFAEPFKHTKSNGDLFMKDKTVKLIPGSLAPQDVLPGGLAPQDVLYGSLTPQAGLHGGLAPQNVLPGGLASQSVLPGALAPHDVLPDGIAPQNVLPEEAEEIDPEATWQRDKEVYLIDEVFPEYSPEWLVNQIKEFKMAWGTDDNRFNEHVALIMEMDKRNIPSRKEWEKQVKEREELDKWSGNMTVNDMIELYGGDPAKHFDDPKRKGVVDNSLYREHSRMGLLDAFKYASKAIVDREFKKAQYSFALGHEALQKMPNSRKTKRPNNEINYPARPSIEFLKEKKFVELRKFIYLEKVRRDDEKSKAIEAARQTNALVVCECCYNECLDQDMVPCNAGHLYCKECVGESVNVAMGEGKTIILCLGQCEEEINTRELQIALPPNVLSKLLSKRQADEVGAADIENLVTCPFCPYSTIMENKEDKVVVCRNPDCGRESCRLCREPNHIPLRCEEVKSKDDIRKRVEEALSDAIIRKCANPKCPASFMKTEGCNKMVCPKCGSVQCYLCKIIVPGYEHFYGQGGEPTETRVCSLWSDDDELHASEVSNAAEKEAEELKKDGVELEYNPKEGIKFLETKK